jgi:uncharacterized protein
MAPRLLLLAAALAAAAPAAAREVPRLTGPVVDEAGLLDGRSRAALEGLCRAARAREGGQGVQLQYLLVRSLEGDSLEDFSIRVAEAWRIGSRGRDNGVLVLVALEDRKVRIEVGGGIEGGLTDAQSGRIVRGTIAPAFRERRYGEGLYAAGVQILSALGAMPEGQARPARPAGGGLSLGLGVLIAFLVIAAVGARLFSAFGGPWGGFGGRGGWGGGLGGGGLSGGGWSGGGGGWSGGGGGFSGGGASGSW